MSIEGQEQENTFDFDTFIQTVQGQRKIKEWFDTEDGKELLQPRLDSYFTKGLNTWKENNLEKMFKEREESLRKELQPDETPEQKRIRELEERDAKRELEMQKRDLFDKARKLTADKNIPEDLVSRFIGSDENETTNNINSLTEIIDNLRRSAKEEALQTVSRDVPTPQTGSVNVEETVKKISELQRSGKVAEAMALRRELASNQAS